MRPWCVLRSLRLKQRYTSHGSLILMITAGIKSIVGGDPGLPLVNGNYIALDTPPAYYSDHFLCLLAKVAKIHICLGLNSEQFLITNKYGKYSIYGLANIHSYVKD
ncbi:hypothetical protein CDAR_504681 [Caerostris darwini]|uniref:Uncharacterized protein n=1 Tax=Caerostris darwini TaxID=1538125 RepID=A0AAV4S8G8_9ARAC|nr:hypothetical protein CDAR_504681 [Caerostris darwini]